MMALQHSRLIPVVISPSPEELSKAEEIIHRCTRDVRVSTHHSRQRGILLKDIDNCMKELLREATSITVDFASKLKGMLAMLKHSEETYDEFIEFKAGDVTVLVKVTAASRRSRTSTEARDIATRFGVVKFKKLPNPWYKQMPVLGWLVGGKPPDEMELKQAMDVVLRSELVK